MKGSLRFLNLVCSYQHFAFFNIFAFLTYYTPPFSFHTAPLCFSLELLFSFSETYAVFWDLWKPMISDSKGDSSRNLLGELVRILFQRPFSQVSYVSWNPMSHDYFKFCCCGWIIGVARWQSAGLPGTLQYFIVGAETSWWLSTRTCFCHHKLPQD